MTSVGGDRIFFLSFFLSFFPSFCLFISFERDRDSPSRGGAEREGEKDRERERIPSRPHADSAEPNAGVKLRKRFIDLLIYRFIDK